MKGYASDGHDPIRTKKYKHSYYRRNRKRILAGNERRRLLYRYDLTLEKFEAMKKEQDDCGALCKRRVKLHIDHIHGTKIVRALLCPKCNGLVGYFETTSQEMLEAIKAYVERHKQ